MSGQCPLHEGGDVAGDVSHQDARLAEGRDLAFRNAGAGADNRTRVTKAAAGRKRGHTAIRIEEVIANPADAIGS